MRQGSYVRAALATVLSGFALVPPLPLVDSLITPDAPPPRLPSGTWFGFNEDWSRHPERIGLASRIGSATSRMPVSWAAVEKQQGHYSWHRYDRAYHGMVSRGIDPILVPVDAPTWARAPGPPCRPKRGCAHPPLPRFDSRWQAFIRNLAARYPLAIAVEPWNEPNLPNFWAGQAINPSRYATLLKLAYGAVKRAVPRMAVISAGLSPRRGGQSDFVAYLRALYNQGFQAYSDGIGFHAYPRDPPWVENTLSEVHDVAAVRDSFGDHGTGIWITETGVSTSGPTTGRAGLNGQARALTGIYQALSLRGDVPVVIVHRLHDIGPARSDDRWDGPGVLRRNWRPKPAYCALDQALDGQYKGGCPARPRER